MACARKTRARVNKCLDELKNLIANTLQPESIGRLTKGDVLELTVAHLKKLKKLQSRNQPTPSGQDKFRGGCCRCVSLVSHSLASVPSNETNTQSSNSDIGNKNGYDVCGKGELSVVTIKKSKLKFISTSGVHATVPINLYSSDPT